MTTAGFSTLRRVAALALMALATVASPARAQDSMPRRELMPAAQAVTLEDAIRMALVVRPAMVQAVTAVKNANAQRRVASGAFAPDLNATSNGNSSFSEGPPRVNTTTGTLESGDSRTDSYGFGFRASVDLFTGFRRMADSRAATATMESAEASYTDAEFQTSLAVTQQFFDALAAQQLVRVREAGVRRGDEQLALSVAKLRVGSATRSDSLRSAVNLGNAKLALVNSLSDVARTQSTLGRTLGLDSRVAAQDDSAFYNFTLGLDTAALQQEALARSPRVQSAEASVRAADANLKAARSTRMPSLTLSGSAGWGANNKQDYVLYANRSLALALSWPLFDRFKTDQAITNRQSSLAVAEAGAADARREIQSSLTTQFAALRAAQVKIDITLASVNAANEDLRVVNERYRVGAATILDVVTSQEAVAQADVDAITARFEYLTAKAQIEALIGHRL